MRAIQNPRVEVPLAPAMHRKRINKSRHQRRPRPPAVEFEMTFVAVGAGCGMIVAVVFEVITRISSLYMFVGAMAGAVLGGMVEVVRFWWRRRKQWREDQKS